MEQNLFEPVYQEIFPFWNEITESDRDCICRNSFVQTYPKGTNIHDGNECSGVIYKQRFAHSGAFFCRILQFAIFISIFAGDYPSK